MIVEVDCCSRMLRCGAIETPCVVGRSGCRPASEKREGDGFTPLGEWTVRGAMLRGNRGFPPPVSLPWRWVREADGWSDDPADPNYNRPVRHPHAFSAERLWRTDALYDAIVLLGHNDAPPQPGAGSAIFLHVLAGDATEGCVAVPREAMAMLLATLTPASVVRIRG